MFGSHMRSAASFYTNPCKWRRSSFTPPSLHVLNIRSHSHLISDWITVSCTAINIISFGDTSKRISCPSSLLSEFPSSSQFRFCIRGPQRFSFIAFASFSSFSDSSRSSLSGGSNGDMDKNRVNRSCDNGDVKSYGKSHGEPEVQDACQSPSQRILTLPTVLTLGRVAAVPLLIATFYVDSWWGRTATTSIFLAAAATDWLDGYLARKMRLGSEFGAFLDPVADKLMVAAALVLLCTRPFQVEMLGNVPWLLTIPSIAIIGREITMSAVREWAASQNSKLLEAVAVNNLGKWKTATQMIALVILLSTRDSSMITSVPVVAVGVILLYVSAGLSVWSLAVYMSKIWRVLVK